VLAELRAAGLIDDDERGVRPHNWDKRQFTSDGSTPRVRRFRDNAETFHRSFLKRAQSQRQRQKQKERLLAKGA
jgi:hypothetical protein